MAAVLAKHRLGAERWDRAFKFCFDRNPWTKTASYFAHKTGRIPEPVDFGQWVLENELPTDWTRYGIGDTVAMDFVGRFEQSSEDLAVVEERIELTIPVLAHPKRRADYQARPGAITHPAVITDAVSDRISQVFRREIALLGYERPHELP